MNHLVTIVKSDGTRQLFEEDKLTQSLRRAGVAPEVADDIVDQVEREMKEGMSTDEIYRRAFDLLKTRSHRAAVKYSIRRALFELGPDGFPFEKFVARIFKLWGYEAITDQTLLGSCIDHEIDVVAWKDDDLAMAEAKFHNEFGMKSDIKVVLYVKARFDDLENTFFDYGGKQRKLGNRYLFTNTKFTDKAAIYAGCKGLKLVGWNYPQKGNLHDIIELYGMHPVTSLTLLDAQQKKNLIGRGVIVCTDLLHNRDVLHEIGLKDDTIDRVIEEANIVMELSK